MDMVFYIAKHRDISGIYIMDENDLYQIYLYDFHVEIISILLVYNIMHI